MQLVVGVADMKASKDPHDVLVTYSLGSCLGVCIYDPVARVGGLLHLMLPESNIDPAKAQANPYMFADTGIPALFREVYRLGGVKERLDVRITGASQILDSAGVFNIGKRNHLAARKILWKNNVLIKAEDVGGTVHRTVRMDLGTGETTIKITGGEVKRL
jgi:chemotaxis protein CheD